MKRLIVLLLMAGFSASAQTTVAYLNEKKEFVKNPQKAKSYVVIRKLADSAFAIDEYDKYDTLSVSGYYKDSLMKVPHGKFVYHRKDRARDGNMPYGWTPIINDTLSFISSAGYYINGNKQGLWLNYSARNRLWKSLTYENDKVDGPYTEYFLNGRLEGQFVKNRREGSWCNVDSSGTVLKEDLYVNDKLVSTHQLLKLPVMPDSYRRYLLKSMAKYKELIDGKQFDFDIVVDEKGFITDPILGKSVMEALVQPLNQIILQSPPVTPGSYDGVAKRMVVKVIYNNDFYFTK